jgi:tetratricopeptide (TPR) repeat protein
MKGMKGIARALPVLALLATLASCSRARREAEQAVFRGRIHLRQTNYSQAAQEFRLAIEKLPKDPEARLFLAETYLRMGNFAEAINEAKTILKEHPGNARAAGQLAIALVNSAESKAGVDETLRARHLGEAEEMVIQLLARDEASAHFVKAHIVAARGNLKDAIALLEKAIAVKEAFPEARFALGGLLLRAALTAAPEEADRIHQQAIVQYQEAAKLDWNRSHEAALSVATVALRRGRVEQAKKQVEEVLKDRENDANALMLLAECHLRQGNVKETLAVCRAVRKINPRAFTEGLTGMAHLRTGDFKKAENDLTQAVKARPRNPRVHFLLGHALEQQGRKQTALTHYAIAIERAPRFAAARLAMARLLSTEERWDEAQRQLHVLVAIAPKTPQAEAKLGPQQREVFAEAKRLTVYVAHSQAGREPGELEKALQTIDKPKEGSAFWAVQGAALKLRQGKASEAVKLLSQAAKDHPREVDIWLALGKTLLGLARIPEGELALRRAEALAPKSAAPHRARAQGYLQLKRRDLAIRQYRAALAKEPDNLVAQRELAGIYLRTTPARAVQAFQKIHDENPESLVDALNLIGAYAAAGQIQQATKLGETLAAKLPDELRIRALLVVLYKRLARPEQAEKHLAVMVEVNPRYVPGYELALLQIADERYKEADALLQKLFAVSKEAATLPHLLVYQSLTKEGQGDHAAALESLYRFKVPTESMKEGAARRRLESLFARHATLVYAAQGKFAKARELIAAERAAGARTPARRMEEAVADMETHRAHAAQVGLRRRRALALRVGGWMPLAEQEARTLVERVPASVPNRLMLASIQMALGQNDRAKRTLEAAIAHRPSSRAYATLGDIAYHASAYKDARYYYTRALKLDRSLENAYLRLGMMAKAEGNMRGAAAVYKAALQNVPRSARVHNELAWIYGQHGRARAQALDMAKKARKLAPRDARIADTLGWMHHLNGQHAEAIPLLYEASAILPRNETVWYHLGTALAADKKKAEAARCFETSLFLAPRSPQAATMREFLDAYRKESAGNRGRAPAPRPR